VAKTKKALLSRRAEMVALIKAEPGITSADIAKRLGLPNSSKVSTALWTSIRSGTILTERAEVDGYWMNKHYLPDQVPPDAVERIRQKLVDAKDVIPTKKSPGTQNSVFDVPSAKRHVKKSVASKNATPAPASTTPSISRPPQLATRAFACAVANDGSLVLMRAGEIAFAAALQSYLVKRAAASLFASMA
jgi:hypothetical protein